MPTARIDQGLVRRACAAVVGWLDEAGEDERALALEALRIAGTATRDEAVLQGVLPTDVGEPFITIERTSA